MAATLFGGDEGIVCINGAYYGSIVYFSLGLGCSHRMLGQFRILSVL